MAAQFPTLFSVGVHSWSAGASDGYGGTEDTFTPPKNAAGVEHPVYGWGPAAATAEPKLAGHDRVVVDLELLVPPAFDCGPHDVIDVPGFGQFEVIGYPEDFNHGPFGFQPGKVVNLRKAEG